MHQRLPDLPKVSGWIYVCERPLVRLRARRLVIVPSRSSTDHASFARPHSHGTLANKSRLA